MTRRVFVDSDIILDLLLAREPHAASATQLFSLFQDRKLEGYVSPVILSNLFYILRQGMPSPQARATLRKLRLILRVLPVDEETIDRALASSFSDFEDAIQHYTAVAHEMSALVTRNRKHYRDAKIPILDAEECIRLHESET
jgi:predicted nucleic acid-binding protein